MGLRAWLGHYWKMKQPAYFVAARMRRDWNERARRNAEYFVATGKKDWTPEEFVASGREWISHHILPDLDLICQGRSPTELRMLELGCGAGRMTRAFSEIFGSVVAVDISSEMIEKARLSVGECKNVEFHVTNGATLPMLRSSEFDFIFSALVFQHIPRKSIVQSYIREAARLLRQGGVFKFQVQGAEISPDDTDTWIGVGFSEQEMAEIAERTGFTVQQATGAGTQYYWLIFLKR